MQDNHDAGAVGTSLQPAAFVSGSQEGQNEGRPGPAPSSMSQQQRGLPPVPLVSQSQEPEVDGDTVAASIASTTLQSNEDGDGSGQQVSLSAETVRSLRGSIDKAVKPTTKGRGRPPKKAKKKGTRGRPRKKDVARGPRPSSPTAKPLPPGLSKRGRPRKGTDVDKAPEDRHKSRARLDRKEKTSDHRGSIHHGARDRSRSTGRRTANVSDPGSKFHTDYAALRRAKLASLATKEEEEQVLKDGGHVATQLESFPDTGHSRQLQPTSATNQPSSQLSRLFGPEQPQPQRVCQRIDLPRQPSHVLAKDHGCIYRGPVVDGKSHGRGSVHWDDGTVYDGDFDSGYRTGRGKIRYSNRDVFEGSFHRGSRTEGKLTYDDGSVYEGRFEFDYSSSPITIAINQLKVPRSKGKWRRFTYGNFASEQFFCPEQAYDDFCPEHTYEDGNIKAVGKYTYANDGSIYGGSVFEGIFIGGERWKGKFTQPDGCVFEGAFFGLDRFPINDPRASLMGVFTYTSDDTKLDFRGDVLALDPRCDASLREGEMKWKDGTFYNGTWRAGRVVRGTLRGLEFTGRYPFCEYAGCPFHGYDWKEGKYYGPFKDGKFHGEGGICGMRWGDKGRRLGWDLTSGTCYGVFKEGKVHGSCTWTKQSFLTCKGSCKIIFRGTVVGGWIWPFVPSVSASKKSRTLWIWPRPAQTGLRFKLDSEVSVNVGDDEWETAYVKGFITDDDGNEISYIVLLESDGHTVLEISDDNDDFIREVVTDFQVGIESHPDFGFFVLYYSGPIVDGKPRGIGVLTVKHSRCCYNCNIAGYGIPDHPSLSRCQRPPVSYDWERDCEVEFGLDYAIQGASRAYRLDARHDELTGFPYFTDPPRRPGFPFFTDPPRQLVWSTKSIYDVLSTKGSIYDNDQNDLHPLFGLIGSVLWNELQSEVASLGELFADEKIPPVHWCDITFSDLGETQWSVSRPGKMC